MRSEIIISPLWYYVNVLLHAQFCEPWLDEDNDKIKLFSVKKNLEACMKADFTTNTCLTKGKTYWQSTGFSHTKLSLREITSEMMLKCLRSMKKKKLNETYKQDWEFWLGLNNHGCAFMKGQLSSSNHVSSFS